VIERIVDGAPPPCDVDPFDWTDERLLLAESFARLDASDAEDLRTWCRDRGVADLHGFVGEPLRYPDWWDAQTRVEFADHPDDVAVEQAAVRWHLDLLLSASVHPIITPFAPAPHLPEFALVDEAKVEGWPVLPIREGAWLAWLWAEASLGGSGPGRWERVRLLGTTWDEAVSLERLLLAPYVAQAVQHRFDIAYEPDIELPRKVLQTGLSAFRMQ
jgi:hypothetical protein